ncbi:MAG TPA: HlyD family secretion protein [Xanthobacteraceae bacterium]|nr:HlyD family secretion protein [Xanthobacteraceae bacterium]
MPLIGIGSIILVALVVAWWLHARNYESTDDAFIDTRTVQISAQVGAAIVDVSVTDNQLVDAGAELIRLDDRDYIAQRDQAQAQVNQAQSSVENLTAQIAAQQAKVDQANKQVTQAQAALTFARQQSERYQQLASRGTAPIEQAQQYSSNLQQSEAGLAAVQANAVATEKQIGVLQAQRDLAYGQVAQARATLEQAQANLSRTIITAPVSGRVTKLTAAKGAYAAVGQALMMFVPREVWVTANFKETQLNLMRPGQPVDITIDAYPGKTFKGHLDSVQSGSGTAFSLLPAENATGNYVKIVQRVPVKIVFDKPPDVLLGPGMSVVPTVKVR